MKMTADQQSKCSKIFDLVDRDKSGFIDKKGIMFIVHTAFVILEVIWLLELGYLLRCLGLRFDPRQVETMVLEFDEDGSGGVELDELEKIIGQIVRISLKEILNIYYLLSTGSDSVSD